MERNHLHGVHRQGRQWVALVGLRLRKTPRQQHGLEMVYQKDKRIFFRGKIFCLRILGLKDGRRGAPKENPEILESLE